MSLLRRPAVVALLLVTVTLLVHWPGEAAFVYDDKEFVVANQSIRSPEGALASLLLPFPSEQPERESGGNPSGPRAGREDRLERCADHRDSEGIG